MKQYAEQTDLQEVFQGTATCFLMLAGGSSTPCLITHENAFELCTSRTPEPGTPKVLFGPFFLGRFIQTNTCYEQNTPVMKDGARRRRQSKQ